MIWYIKEKFGGLPLGACSLIFSVHTEPLIGKDALSTTTTSLKKHFRQLSCNLTNACFYHFDQVHSASWFCKDAILYHACQFAWKLILVCCESCCSGNLFSDLLLVLLNIADLPDLGLPLLPLILLSTVPNVVKLGSNIINGLHIWHPYICDPIPLFSLNGSIASCSWIMFGI